MGILTRKLSIILATTMMLSFTGCTVSNDESKVEESNKTETEQIQSENTSTKENPEGFRIVTIGTSGPPVESVKTWPSTLVQYKDKYFLVDCGGGTTHGLVRAGIDIGKINNILFTHHHNDHNSDALTLLVGAWGTPDGRRELNMIGPSGTQKLYDFTIDFYGEDLEYRTSYGFPKEGLLSNVNIQEVSGGEELEIDGVKITTVSVPHSIETVAYKFEADGQSVVVTGDMTYNNEVIELAKDVDIMVIDGMLAEVKTDDPNYEVFQKMKPNLLRAHLSLEELAKTATDANVSTVVLTHLALGEIDEEYVNKVLSDSGYTGKVIIAETLGTYDVE